MVGMWHAVTLETTVEEALRGQSRFTATNPVVTCLTGLSLREMEIILREMAKTTQSDDITYLLDCIDTIRQRDGAR